MPFSHTLLAGLILRPDGRLHLLSHGLEDDPAESLVEEAVDDKVHDGVEHEEEVVHGGHAHEPDGRPEAIAAQNHLE